MATGFLSFWTRLSNANNGRLFQAIENQSVAIRDSASGICGYLLWIFKFAVHIFVLLGAFPSLDVPRYKADGEIDVEDRRFEGGGSGMNRVPVSGLAGTRIKHGVHWERGIPLVSLVPSLTTGCGRASREQCEQLVFPK